MVTKNDKLKLMNSLLKKVHQKKYFQNTFNSKLVPNGGF